jgi:hypothetical protein
MWPSVLNNWYRNNEFQKELNLAQFAAPGNGTIRIPCWWASLA